MTNLSSRRRALLGAAILLAASVAPTASASFPLEGRLTVSSAQSRGSTTVQAPLVALFQDDATATDAAADPAFTLTASFLHVQTYQSDPAFHPSSGNPIDGGQNKTDAYYHDAFVQGVQVRPNHHWAVFPSAPGDATLQATSACTDLTPSSSSSQTQISKVYYPAPDASVTVTTSNTLEWRDCSGAASLTVTGDFFVMMWEWDATLRSGGQDTPLPSGEGQSTHDPVGAPETTRLVSHDRQRYLYVEGGTLTVPVPGGSGYQAYLGPHAHFHADAGWGFHGATGRFTQGVQGIDLQSSMLEVQGSLDLDATGTDARQPFQAGLAGKAQQVQVDGRLVPLPGAAGAPDLKPLWPYLGGAAALLAVGATAVFWRARNPLWLLRRADRSGEVRHYRRASLWSGLAARRDPTSGLAHFVKAFSLTCLGRYEAALASHRHAQAVLQDSGDSELAARNAIEAALTCDTLHRGQDAITWLRAAHASSPAITYAALMQPDKRPLQGLALQVLGVSRAYV